jgi:hypothetical protein
LAIEALLLIYQISPSLRNTPRLSGRKIYRNIDIVWFIPPSLDVMRVEAKVRCDRCYRILRCLRIHLPALARFGFILAPSRFN